ncbi:hypothetical protein AARAC_001624 [Aspergillus arachidicola]|uniref:NACHT domain-containing protein n=1 Tax=Aspergillus arachidicola TaxID=656916 RepID=A0A2G7FIM1_9EURO|nr:hypothetical protein AARAC_001624 [Aspergillus arachidicola]
MGLSKLFPCIKKKREEAQLNDNAPNNNDQSNATAQGTSPDKKNPPILPPVATVSKDSAGPSPSEQEPPAKVKEQSNISTSQRVWNRAYDELADDEGTADLVKAYVAILANENKSEGDGLDSFDMDTAEQRQASMKRALKAGQARVAKSVKATSTVGGVVGFVNKFKGVIDVAVSSNPQAALPWAGVCVGLQFLLNPAQASKDQRDGLSYVISRMNWYCSLTDHILNEEKVQPGDRSYQSVLDELEGRVVVLYKALLKFQMKSACSYNKNQAKVFLKNMINLDDWAGEREAVEAAEKAVEDDTKTFIDIESRDRLNDLVHQGQDLRDTLGDFHQTVKDYFAAQRNMERSKEERECLGQLSVVNPEDLKDGIEGRNDILLPATYEWIFETPEYKSFVNWSNPDACRVLWLNGPAGTGKSMLMIGILNELAKQPSNMVPSLSYFFFEAGRDHQKTPADAIRSLVWMLAIQQPQLVHYILDASQNSGSGYFNGADIYWALEKILIKMLNDDSLSPVYLGLDALDECDEGGPGVGTIQELIAKTLKQSKKVKWILSSRPEVNMLKRLKNDLPPSSIADMAIQSRPDAIKVYIKYKLSQLETRLDYGQTKLNEVSTEIFQRSQNTFLWVSLVFKDILENSVSEFDVLPHIKETPSDLDKLYDRFMAKIKKKHPTERTYCIEVIAACCLANRPLSIPELSVLAGLPDDHSTNTIVPRCGSFLTVNDGVILMTHNSARQYLDRYFESHTEGGIGQRHLDLAKRSIDAMSKTLKRNIYDVNPGSDITDIHVPENDPLVSIRYSCEYWPTHLLNSERYRQRNGDASQLFVSFIQDHLLHWLESLSLIDRLPRAIPALASLEKNYRYDEDVAALFTDALTFTRRNTAMIKQYPLQVYGTALALSPTNSGVRLRHWHEKLPCLQSISGVMEGPDPCIQILDSRSMASSLVFSSEGDLLVSGSLYKPGTIVIWETSTGVCKQVLKNEIGGNMALAFGPKGDVLASACRNEVRIWDINTGVQKQTLRLSPGPRRKERVWETGPPTQHGGQVITTITSVGEAPDCYGDVKSLAFSSDGKFLASVADDDDIVKLWDLSTETFKTIDERAVSITFSPDDKLLAIASVYDKLVIWDIEAGKAVRSSEYIYGPQTVVFSRETTIASILVNGSACLWDSASNEHQIFHFAGLKAGAFVANEKAIAFSTTDGHIKIFDIDRQEFTRDYFHGDHVALASSGIGRLASGGRYGNVLLWDLFVKGGKAATGHEKEVSMIRFSPDGTMVVTGSDDATLKIWDPLGTCKQTLTGHTKRVFSVVFPPDGKCFASGSWDGTVRLWDTATGAPGQTLGQLPEAVKQVTFSPDGTLLAATTSSTVKVWDVTTGGCRQTVEDSSDIFLSATISQNNAILVTGGYDAGLRLWDLETGDHKQKMGKAIVSVAISPDCQTVAGGNFDREVKIWVLSAASDPQVIRSEDVRSPSLRFSNDGQYLQVAQRSYKLSSGVVATSPSLELSKSLVFVTDEWVMRGEQKLLRVPPGYSANVSDSWQNTAVLGNQSGQVIFLQLDQ